LEGVIYTITENGLHHLVESLTKKYDIYGPVKTSDEAVFSKFRFKLLEAKDQLELHYGITTTPPTKYLFPSREKILGFVNGKETNSKTKKPKKKIIFGLDMTDLMGINRLDKEFLEPITDKVYAKNRENTYLFSIDHFNLEQDMIYDLHFKKTGASEYEVLSGSDFGEQIIKNHPLFKKATSKSKESLRPNMSPIYHQEIAEIIASSKDDPIWDELAETCFGCGICTYVCPLCYCFEIEDKVTIEGCSKCDGCRERRWDSCMLSDFAAISSHDFRPELRNRIYNWYHHKFVRTPKEHGFVGCVDCERCITYCPAKINFHETLNYLIKKYT